MALFNLAKQWYTQKTNQWRNTRWWESWNYFQINNGQTKRPEPNRLPTRPRISKIKKGQKGANWNKTPKKAKSDRFRNNRLQKIWAVSEKPITAEFQRE